jgi:DNA-binding transcriptional ArsR family regulator
MAEFEEETYSTVFAALKHPIRRRLLRVLSEGSRSFTDMQNSLNINSPILTYHLETLRDLVSKTEDGKYKLSSTGEGATALMERVEEAPKPVPRTLLLPRWKRVLTLLQLTAAILAVALLITGGYLVSVSSTQSSLALPYQSFSTQSPTTVDGVVYNTSITIHVPPPEGLVINRVEHISVGIKNIQNLSQGIFNITLRYVEYSPSEDTYVPTEENTAGQFVPSEAPNGIIFSDFISLPPSLGLSIDQQPLPRDIVISILTNTTSLNPPLAFSIEAPIYGNAYIETQPYRDQGFQCIAGGITVLIAVLTLSALFAIDEHKHQSGQTSMRAS